MCLWLQSNILENMEEEISGGVQSRSVPSHSDELHVLDLLWTTSSPSKQYSGGDHQQHWACSRVDLPHHIFRICSQQRPGMRQIISFFSLTYFPSEPNEYEYESQVVRLLKIEIQYGLWVTS